MIEFNVIRKKATHGVNVARVIGLPEKAILQKYNLQTFIVVLLGDDFFGRRQRKQKDAEN